MTFFSINNNILLQKSNTLKFKNNIKYIYFKSALLYLFMLLNTQDIFFYISHNYNARMILFTRKRKYFNAKTCVSIHTFLRCISCDIKVRLDFSFTHCTILCSIKNKPSSLFANLFNDSAQFSSALIISYIPIIY